MERSIDFNGQAEFLPAGQGERNRTDGVSQVRLKAVAIRIERPNRPRQARALWEFQRPAEMTNPILQDSFHLEIQHRVSVKRRFELLGLAGRLDVATGRCGVL